MSDVDPIEAVERALAMPRGSHYGHFDRTGGAGSGCEACHDESAREQALRAALPDLVALREERDALAATVRIHESFECDSGCDSYGHTPTCMVATPFAALRARVRELEALCGTAAGFIDYGHDPDDDSKVDNIRAALRAASRGAQP